MSCFLKMYYKVEMESNNSGMSIKSKCDTVKRNACPHFYKKVLGTKRINLLADVRVYSQVLE